MNKNSNCKLKKITISKIILTLIYNFKGSEEYDEEFSDELNEIENENIDTYIIIIIPSCHQIYKIIKGV